LKLLKGKRMEPVIVCVQFSWLLPKDSLDTEANVTESFGLEVSVSALCSYTGQRQIGRTEKDLGKVDRVPYGIRSL